MAEPNTAFIDINTEPALKIAWTLKLENVARAAFRILVVEGALDVLAAQPRRRATRHTIFGRPRADLPDDLQTVIQQYVPRQTSHLSFPHLISPYTKYPVSSVSIYFY